MGAACPQEVRALFAATLMPPRNLRPDVVARLVPDRGCSALQILFFCSSGGLAPPEAVAVELLSGFRGLRPVVSGVDGLDSLIQRLLKDAFADGGKHRAEESPLEVLTVPFNYHVNIGRPRSRPRPRSARAGSSDLRSPQAPLGGGARAAMPGYRTPPGRWPRRRRSSRAPDLQVKRQPVWGRNRPGVGSADTAATTARRPADP